jgi:hypothetical protein
MGAARLVVASNARSAIAAAMTAAIGKQRIHKRPMIIAPSGFSMPRHSNLAFREQVVVAR